MGLLDMFGRKPRTEGEKARKTREFKEESERLRKEALAKKPAAKPANRMGKGPSTLNPAEVKNRNTARFQDKSEALRKDALKKGAPEIKKAKFLAESERLKKAALAKDAAENKKENVTGEGGRSVGSGREEKTNVTREQLQKTGLSLRDYLNFMDKNNRRPNKSDAAAAKKITAGFEAKKAKKMMGGGMAMKSKGYSKGGAMKTKGYKKGGKVRGAGIARKGVRPAKMR
jgi:hypothetical protein